MRIILQNVLNVYHFSCFVAVLMTMHIYSYDALLVCYVLDYIFRNVNVNIDISLFIYF